MSTCGEPCDGCPNRAEHHLCDACCHDEVNAIQKENRELRDEVERLKAELDEKSGYLADVEKLISYKDYISDKTCAENMEVVLRGAFQRGAEAMREAAIRVCEEPQMGTEAETIRALPVPEDKP